MRAGGFTIVKNARRTKDIRNRGLRRLGERSRPLPVRRHPAEVFFLHFLTLLNLLLLLRRWLREFSINTQRRFDPWIVAARDSKFLDKYNRIIIGVSVSR